MLTERQPTQHVSSTPVSLGLNVLFGKIDISALLQKQAVAEFSSKHLQTLMWKIAPKGPIPPPNLYKHRHSNRLNPVRTQKATTNGL